jgi:hypothetical protein
VYRPVLSRLQYGCSKSASVGQTVRERPPQGRTGVAGPRHHPDYPKYVFDVFASSALAGRPRGTRNGDRSISAHVLIYCRTRLPGPLRPATRVSEVSAVSCGVGLSPRRSSLSSLGSGSSLGGRCSVGGEGHRQASSSGGAEFFIEPNIEVTLADHPRRL